MASEMSLWELAAVVLSIAYLLLAVKENNLCWYAAFFSTLIFTFLFWDASLLMDSALQIYYLAMAVYGWYQWQSGPSAAGADNCGSETGRPISVWPWSRHAMAIVSVVVVSCLSGIWLSENTRAALPYLDSFTTWGSVLTTYMVAKKILENWIYWLVIDTVSVYLYLDRGLYITAFLFGAYVVIAVVGFWKWLQHYQREQVLCSA